MPFNSNQKLALHRACLVLVGADSASFAGLAAEVILHWFRV